MAPGPALAATSLGWQCSFSWAPPSPEQVAAIYRSLCSSFQVAPAEYRWQLDLACISQEAPGPVHLVDSFRTCRSTTQPPQGTQSRGWLSRHWSPNEVSLAAWNWPLHSWSSMVVSAGPLSQSASGKSLPLWCSQQSRLNYNGRVCTAHTVSTPRVPSSGDWETVPLDPTGHLPHKATLPRPRDREVLPNT